MREGRNKLLKTDLEIKKITKRKIIIYILIFNVISIILLSIFSYWITEGKIQEINSIVPISIMALIFGNTLYIPLTVSTCKPREQAKNSIIFVNLYLSTKEFLEVIPIHTDRYEKFILGLTDIAEFYAIRIGKHKIEIWIKFNNESEKRYFQTIYDEYFTDYYCLKEENKQEKEKDEED